MASLRLIWLTPEAPAPHSDRDRLETGAMQTSRPITRTGWVVMVNTHNSSSQKRKAKTIQTFSVAFFQMIHSQILFKFNDCDFTSETAIDLIDHKIDEWIMNEFKLLTFCLGIQLRCYSIHIFLMFISSAKLWRLSSLFHRDCDNLQNQRHTQDDICNIIGSQNQERKVSMIMYLYQILLIAKLLHNT